MNPFVHQLGSPGNRCSVDGTLCTAFCWREWGTWRTPWRRFSRNVASPWRSVKALLLPTRETDNLDMSVENDNFNSRLDAQSQ